MSKAGIGAIVTVIVVVLNYFGVVLPEGSDQSLVEAIMTVGGLIFLVWGQLERKDLKFGLIRK